MQKNLNKLPIFFKIIILFAATYLGSNFVFPVNSVKSATVIGDGILVYATSTNATIQYRTYASSTNAFSNPASNAESSTVTIHYLHLEGSPTSTEKIMAVLDDQNVTTNDTARLTVMRWTGANWITDWTSSLATSSRQSVDLAYYGNTGNAIIVYATSTASINGLAYRTWNGSTWSATSTLTFAAPLSGANGYPVWVEAEGFAIATSTQKVIMGYQDSVGRIGASIWDGSSWGVSTSTGIGLTTNANATRHFDVALESISGDALWAFGFRNAVGIQSATCLSGCSSWTTVAPVLLTDDSDFVDMAAAPFQSNAIALVGSCSINATGDDVVKAAVWQDTWWASQSTNLDAATICDTATISGTLPAAVGWYATDSSVATGTAFLLYNDAATANTLFRWVITNSTGAWGASNITTGVVDIGAAYRSHKIYSWPGQSSAMVSTITGTIANPLLTHTVTENDTLGTDPNPVGGGAEGFVQAPLSGFAADFDFYKVPSPVFNQQNYQWFTNTNNLDPGASLAATNTSYTLPDTTTPLRLRMNALAATSSAALNSTVFKLQYTNSTTTNGWTDVGGSSAWIFKDNAGVVASTTLNATSTLLNSNTMQSYTEANNTPPNPRIIPAGQTGEWDFALDPVNSTSTIYYFRLVHSDGTVFNSYENYPKISALPVLTQQDYRFYTNTDSIDAGAALANENTLYNVTSTSTPIRLKMNVGATITSLATTSKQFKLQWSTNTTSGWTDVGISGATSSTGWWDTSWKNRRKITFSGATSTVALANFPVAVILNSSNIDYSKTQSAGQDIRFIDTDSSTQLDYEIEKWDETATSTTWVRVPSIATSATDYIWMYYNNTNASDNATTTGVWDSDHVGVWHLNENTGNHDDSATANSNSTTITVATQGTATGTFNGADKFTSATSHLISIPDSADWDLLGNWTIEAWVEGADDDSAPQSVFGRSDSVDATLRWSLQANNSSNVPGCYNESADTILVSSSIDLTANTREHLVCSYDGTTRRFHLDGVQRGSLVQSPGNADDAAVLKIGFSTASSGFNTFLGIIDEVRISKAARSNAWIEAEYKNGVSTYNTFGSEESLPIAWSFYDNSSVADGATTTANLSTSDVGESYTESNPTALNLFRISVSKEGEWDFVLDPTNATSTYYFRMVYSDDTEFDAYSNYPNITVGEGAAATTFTQRNYNWFANQNSLTPAQSLNSINSGISSVTDDDVRRLRIDVVVGGADLATSTSAFLLQFKTLGSGCSAVETWTNVGAIASSSVVWIGYDNSSITDGATTTVAYLDSANRFESYEEQNSSVKNLTTIDIARAGEFDWVIQDNSATVSTTYCFRMVDAAGETAFGTYTNYPTIVTASRSNSGLGGSGGSAAEVISSGVYQAPTTTPSGGSSSESGGGGAATTTPNPDQGGGGGDSGFGPLGKFLASIGVFADSMLKKYWLIFLFLTIVLAALIKNSGKN